MEEAAAVAAPAAPPSSCQLQTGLNGSACFSGEFEAALLARLEEVRICAVSEVGRLEAELAQRPEMLVEGAPVAVLDLQPSAVVNASSYESHRLSDAAARAAAPDKDSEQLLDRFCCPGCQPASKVPTRPLRVPAAAQPRYVLGSLPPLPPRTLAVKELAAVGTVVQTDEMSQAVGQQQPPAPSAPMPAPPLEGQQPKPPPDLEEMVSDMVRQAHEHQHELHSGLDLSPRAQDFPASRKTFSGAIGKPIKGNQAKVMASSVSRLQDMFNAVEDANFQRIDIMGTSRHRKSTIDRIKKDPKFRGMISDAVMGVVVLLNIAVMGASSDLCPDCWGWVVVDTIFALVFLAELVGKLLVFGVSMFLCGPDRWWNLFEAGLVVLALAEVIMVLVALLGDGSNGAGPGMALFRLVRVFRITRVLRVCRLELFSELMVMIKGTMGGARTLMWSIVLISLPLYAVALLLRETVGNVPEHPPEQTATVEMFSSVGMSFFALFTCIVSGECSEENGRPIFLLLSKHFGSQYALLFCIVSMFMTFGLFNVIVAIFVENVVAAARNNEQSKKRAHMRDQVFFAQKLVQLLEVIWDLLGKKHEGSPQELLESAKEGFSLTPDAFDELRKNARFSEILEQLDIAMEDQYALFETLDGDQSGVIDFDELIGGIHMLRGEARRSDIIAVNIHVAALQNQFGLFVEQFDEFVAKVVSPFNQPRTALNS